MSRFLTVALEVLVIGLILFVPLSFGGTQYWVWTTMELGVALALMIWLVLSLVNHRLCIVKTPLNIVIALFLLFVFVQLVGMPAGITHMLSSGRVALQVTGNPSAQGYATPEGRMALSVNRAETLQSWFRLLAYGGFFFLLVNWLDTRAKVARVLVASALAGVLLVFLGMMTTGEKFPEVYREVPTGDVNEKPTYLNVRADKQFSSGEGFERSLTDTGSVHWFMNKVKGGAAFGSFPTENQAAGFMLMLIPVALATLMACIGTRRSEWGQSGGFLFSTEGNLAILSVVVMATLLLGVFITNSREGVLVAVIAVLVTMLAIGWTGSLLKGIITTAVMALVVGVSGMIVAGNAGLKETIHDAADMRLNDWNEGRTEVMSASKKIASDFPLTGTGSGTYGSIYPLYSEGGPKMYYARCDAMQFRVENGWLGILLAAAGLIIYVATAVVGLIKMRDKFMRRILLGTLLGSLAVLGHGLLEYDLYVPATAIVFVVLAAVTVVLAQDHNSRQREEDYAF